LYSTTLDAAVSSYSIAGIYSAIVGPKNFEVIMGKDFKRLVVDQFTQQATPFRQFAEMPGRPREMVLAATKIGPEDTVLDVACGPGVMTCDLAEVARHATGIDITPAMIEQAKKVQKDKGLTNVTWCIGAVPPLPFDDDAFSLVVTRYSFHHFVDPLVVLNEMVRVCKPSGRIVVVDVFMTTPEQADAYNHLEMLRDPSHLRALLLDELIELFVQAGLRRPKVDFYKQPMALEPLLKGSFPKPGDEQRVRQIIVDDVEKNELGLDAEWRNGEVHFAYPIAVLACSKQ
jgi:ubiquinone/menaquinone biosynthesis C-methylase UbiE